MEASDEEEDPELVVLVRDGTLCMEPAELCRTITSKASNKTKFGHSVLGKELKQPLELPGRPVMLGALPYCVEEDHPRHREIQQHDP